MQRESTGGTFVRNDDIRRAYRLIEELACRGLTVEQLLTRANRLFCQNTLESHYATLVCGRSVAPGAVELANAGHWPKMP